ncbi:hypothetical protein [Undibacterium sp. RuRC25W]|uniref:hypothetical protein n=1 Tax=Undibacterium sp. RuRC25W TaxID=3413047 RepID=UPI003BF03448
MDPVSLLVMALAKNPELAASAAGAVLKPGTVDVEKMQGNLVDLSKGILTCYHRTAKFRQTDVVATPWDRAWQYGAERSAVIRINFQGMTTMPYQMLVAVMIKGNSVRSAVIQENTAMPYNKKCELEDWVSSK